MAKKIEKEETGLEILLGTILAFCKVTAALLVAVIVIGFITGKAPERNSPIDYQVQDN